MSRDSAGKPVQVVAALQHRNQTPMAMRVSQAAQVTCEQRKILVPQPEPPQGILNP